VYIASSLHEIKDRNGERGDGAKWDGVVASKPASSSSKNQTPPQKGEHARREDEEMGCTRERERGREV